jgi:hypothetical protein
MKPVVDHRAVVDGVLYLPLTASWAIVEAKHRLLDIVESEGQPERPQRAGPQRS